jgi:hypothetical protein
MKGALLRPSDDGYDEARTIWNAMVDRRPALIADNLFRVNQNIQPD